MQNRKLQVRISGRGLRVTIEDYLVDLTMEEAKELTIELIRGGSERDCMSEQVNEFWPKLEALGIDRARLQSTGFFKQLHEALLKIDQ